MADVISRGILAPSLVDCGKKRCGGSECRVRRNGSGVLDSNRGRTSIAVPFQRTKVFNLGIVAEARTPRAVTKRALPDGSVSALTTTTPITFHMGESTLTLPFSPEAAKGLTDAIDGLFTTFKERESATRPKRWKMMEFQQRAEDGLYLEVFCNPNAYANVFQAKVLITLNDEKIKITSEGPLSALRADVDEYISKNK